MSMPASAHAETRKPVAGWRKVLAAILDFFSAFFVAGYAVGYLTGNLTNDGFELKGASALIVFALVAAYFVVFIRLLGGTVWQRILGARSSRARE